jgi:hypothetical protein
MQQSTIRPFVQALLSFPYMHVAGGQAHAPCTPPELLLCMHRKVCGVGPGLIFAEHVLEDDTVAWIDRVGTIALVPCAVGGTCVDEWLPGSHLYQSMASLSIQQ